MTPGLYEIGWAASRRPLLYPPPDSMARLADGGLVKRLSLILLACWLAGPLASARPDPREEWVALTGGPFRVFSNAQFAGSADVLLALEQLRAVVSSLSTHPVAAERPTVLYAFSFKDSIARDLFNPPQQDVVPMGEVVVAPEATYVVLNADEPLADVLPWVYRAYLEQDLLRRYPRLPRWARSGLGHFYATLEVRQDDRVRTGLPDKGHLEILRTAQWIPLAHFFAAERDSALFATGRSLQLYEAQAWLLTHYLMVGTDAPTPRTDEFHAGIESGLSAEETVRRVLGVDLESLERSLAAHARSANLRTLELAIDALPNQRRQPTPVAAPEIALRLGRLLVRLYDPPPAEAVKGHLEPLREDAGLAGDALATLALLSERSGRRNEALALFGQAMAAGPRQAVSFLDYALLLERADEAPEERRQVLERAVAIDPNLGEAWMALAGTYGENDPDAFVRHAERALELMPERADLAYNLAIAHLRAGDPPGARRVVAEHLGNPDDHDLAARAKREITMLATVAAADEALRTGAVETAIEHLHRALAETGDAAKRAHIEAEIAQLELRARRKARVEAFNAAVALVNAGQLTEAREALLRLLPEVEDAALRAAVEDLLGRLAEADE